MNDSMAHRGRGDVLVCLDRVPEALQAYDRAIQHKPNDHAAHRGRGNVLAELGRLPEALQAYNRVIQCQHKW